MNSINPIPDSSNPNELTRRNFIKKTALTAGGIALLGQGIGLADGESGSSESPHVHEKFITEGVVSDGKKSYRWYYYSCACGWSSDTYIEDLP